MSARDSNLMKQQLALRNKILEFEKMNEKNVNEVNKDMEARMAEIKRDGAGELDENAVKANELEEGVKAMKDIERKKIVYELELFEWGQQCKKL